MVSIDILCPTGHLATVPFEEESFLRGVDREPDFICADSGSNDIGPKPFGADQPVCEPEWQRHDIELMVRASRELDVPMIIGSASDTGSNRGVDAFVEFVREVAAEHSLDEFTLAALYSEIDQGYLLERIDSGEIITGLNERSPLDRSTVEESSPIVAAMGIEPFLAALDAGADVIIAGRSVDPAIFAGALVWSGIPKGTAYFAGKLMECASFVAEPYAGKESILGTITEDEVVIEALADYQKTTPESLASHAMYERSNPFLEHVPGGHVDMEHCTYEAVDNERARASGAVFEENESYTEKLEGARPVGERYLKILGIRDPHILEHLDEAITYSREKVAERFGDEEYDVYYHVYGKNGVMGELEPNQAVTSHELGIIVEGIAPEEDVAKAVTSLAGSSFFYVRIPGIKSTAGTAAFLADETLATGTAYEWSVNHTLLIDDPLDLHDTTYLTMGGDADD